LRLVPHKAETPGTPSTLASAAAPPTYARAFSDIRQNGVVRDVESATWRQLVAAIPWLGRLSPALATRIDLTEFVVPSGHVAHVRRQAEQLTGAYVMTYRREKPTPQPGRIQLCQVIEAAELDDIALAALLRAESHLAGARVALCAYARPL
jgi:hypothetical protein